MKLILLKLNTISRIVGLTAIGLVAISANAEITIHTSLDEKGKNQILVKNDQQQLPPPQLGIMPPVINDKLNRSTGKLDKSLTLYNYSSKPKKIKLSFIDLDINGKPVASTDTTLKNWVLINPTQFTIAGNGYQTIRLSVRPPKGFAKQTYKAALMIEQQIDNAMKYDPNGKGVTVELGSRYGLPIVISVE